MYNMLLQVGLLFLVSTYAGLGGSKVFAKESTPSARLETRLVGESRELDIILDSEDVFKIRPETQLGSTQVWDYKEQRWVEGSGLWSQLPQSSDNIKIRFSKSTLPKKIFNLIFQNPLTAKLYYSPQFTVWDAIYVRNYISKLNNNLDNQSESSASKVWEW